MFFEKSSETHKKRHLIYLLVVALTLFTIAALVTHPTTGSRLTIHRIAPWGQARTGQYLIYWTPHKTGSSSMRLWLKIAARDMDIPLRVRTKYPYIDFLDWHRKANQMTKGDKCGFVAGHIRVFPVSRRPHEGTLGAVISTTRDEKDTLASKHFHRTWNDLNRDFDQMTNITTEEARRWFFYFNDLDPCEQLRYYDGEEGCDKDENLLMKRARNIAERIDCVVDTDDAGPDVQVLCEVMKVKNCPDFPRVNKRGYSLYDELFNEEFVTDIMQRVLKVTRILRTELMKRRCRFLKDGSGLSTPGLEAPNWPTAGCSEDT